MRGIWMPLYGIVDPAVLLHTAKKFIDVHLANKGQLLARSGEWVPMEVFDVSKKKKKKVCKLAFLQTKEDSYYPN